MMALLHWLEVEGEDFVAAGAATAQSLSTRSPASWLQTAHMCLQSPPRERVLSLCKPVVQIKRS